VTPSRSAARANCRSAGVALTRASARKRPHLNRIRLRRVRAPRSNTSWSRTPSPAPGRPTSPAHTGPVRGQLVAVDARRPPFQARFRRRSRSAPLSLHPSATALTSSSSSSSVTPCCTVPDAAARSNSFYPARPSTPTERFCAAVSPSALRNKSARAFSAEQCCAM